MSDVMCNCGLNPPHKIVDHIRLFGKRVKAEYTDDYCHNEHADSHSQNYANHSDLHHGYTHQADGCACSASNKHGNHTYKEADCGCGCSVSHNDSQADLLRFSLSAVFFALGLIGLKFVPENFLLERFGVGHIMFVISWVLSGYKVFFASLKNISKGKVFDENFLMTIASLGAFGLAEFHEAAAVMLFYNLGELIQHKAAKKSGESIIALMDLNPEFARIVLNAENLNKEQLVNPAKVRVGAIVLVKAGEKIPLDGIIQKGSASLDTSSMTGESIPRSVGVGDEVLGGFINTNGLLVIKTTKLFSQTAASKMLTLIEESQSRKAPVEKFITSFAKVYTPTVVIAAVLLSILPAIILSILGIAPIQGWSSFAPWVSRSLVFLVISCPCALVISVPLSYFAGIGGAAKRGILIKGADYIDALAKATTVVFDKTGTLTTGKLSVSNIITANKSEKEVLYLAAIAEQNSNHPIAKAIVEYAKDKNVMVNNQIDNYTEIIGKGVKITLKGKTLLVGNYELIAETCTISLTNIKNMEGKTNVYVVYENEYIGCITLTDSLKPTSKSAIQKLKSLGLKNISMLTGDSKNIATSIANKLGLSSFFAELLPHEKVAHFEKITTEVKTRNKKASILFVGDGINDAPVLARADAGIAMGALGSDAAIEAADIVLMNDNPELIPEAIKHSGITRKIVKQNILLVLFVKLAFLTLGAFGLIGMEAAIFADVGIALIAILNSMRARR